MLPKKIEEIVAPVVASFVESQNGFYRKHCSDELLTALIMYQMGNPSRRNSMHSVAEEIVIGGDQNAAYDAVCWLFENVLEHGCHAGGNGHHVAQSFTAIMEPITGIDV